MSYNQTAKRRPSQKPAAIPFEQRDFPREIIRRLEQIVAISGTRPLPVFEDFTYLSEATLRVLPDQVRAVGATRRFAPDPPEVAEVFARVRSHYDTVWLTPDRVERVWQNFGEAFALLLEATAPGLWGEPNSLNVAGPLSGPDILGFIFQTWANPSAGKWNSQYMTPWPIAAMIGRLLIGPEAERQIHDRVKQALSHPDNILGQAVLLAGLLLPDNQPEIVRDYFFNQVLPASLPFVSPLTLYEPAIGTGILHMGAAAVFPAWAVRYAVVKFLGGDKDPLMVSASQTALRLYGLNGYALQLEAAVAEALQSRQQQAEQPAAVFAPGQAIRTVYRNDQSWTPSAEITSLSFEQLFRVAAKRSAAAVTSR